MSVPSREVRFNKLLWGTALLPIMLMLAASLLLARLVERLLNDARWVDHTDQVIAQARSCKETGLRMQSGWRALQVANRTKDREAYVQSSRQIEENFDTLQRLVSDNPAQERRLGAIRASFNQWGALAAKAVERPQPQKENAAPAIPEAGEVFFDQFARGLDEFVGVEEGLRLRRNDALELLDKNIRRWRALILLSAGTFLSLVLWRQLRSIAGLYQKSEAAASERAETLQTTLASIADAVIATNAQGQVTFLNGAAEKLTGWRSAEAEGKPAGQVLNLFRGSDGDRAPMQEPFGKVLQEGITLVLPEDTLMRARDGREFPIAASGSPIQEKAGSLRGMVLVFRDATEENRRQSLQAHLAAIVKSSDDAIISKDLNGTITAWNEAAIRIFGHQAEEAIGKSITILIPPERQQEEPAILEAIRRGDRVNHYETVRVRKDGRPLHVSVTISPILDKSGRVVGASKIARDITRQKEDQEALRRARNELEMRVEERTKELSAANDQLRQLDQFRSRFLAAMSHELRTPLNSIIGFTEILKEGRAGPVTEKQAQYLGMAHGSAKHLLNLINDLLDLARIEAGKDEVFIEPFELPPLVQEALQTVQTAAQLKHLKLESDVAVNAPIYSDRKKVYQVMLNFLSNAVKFTDQGKVCLEARTEGDRLLVTVSDTGIGMTPEQLAILFGEFRRFEHPNRRIYEGAGLGLYLCKNLVILLGGEIWAESERGKGSRFSFKIPAGAIKVFHGKAQNIVG